MRIAIEVLPRISVTRLSSRAATAAALVISLYAAPSRFVGAQACVPCHAAEFASQSASAHAKALSLASDSVNLHVGRLSREERYHYRIVAGNRGLRVQIDDGVNLMDLPLEWVFGAGRQAVTFVTRINGDWYLEHYSTWYSATNAYGPTPGQQELRPKSIQEAAGLLYKVSDRQFGIQGCFECHSTGPVSFDRQGHASIGENGVRCESCHGPGSTHVASGGHSQMTNPARLSAAELNDFCGRCHRRPDKESATDWNYVWNIRHEPVYLSQSRCFLKSGGRLSCLTCHSPHEAVANNRVAFYNGKCLECHSGCVTKARENCIDCHMPRVSPQPPLRFTNHWIGIYRSGGKLRPVP